MRGEPCIHDHSGWRAVVSCPDAFYCMWIESGLNASVPANSCHLKVVPIQRYWAAGTHINEEITKLVVM